MSKDFAGFRAIGEQLNKTNKVRKIFVECRVSRIDKRAVRRVYDKRLSAMLLTSFFVLFHFDIDF